ncbi:PucR family transcriptional regulator [Streptomyces johnsoniae]|uniref:PucR family transcriptional regulator n=1 Tax=Streptomyces johnsoniae TaxID=3075532 RepID=A0ABU2SA65_9ACTN|nr:PucR family transcriptional regulator [Streptomyces sp. DSM 41886]MDT0445807.1 PucR family transcriptional regulator [Streptomyces sp. DSM 41886]
MPLSVRELVARREFRLTVVAGEAGLDRPITWVHASEVPDPTPWLEAGSLVLTTGVGHEDPASVAAMARRLAATGAAGIGIAVDLVYRTVPPEVAAVGEETGLPVLVVPYATPFVAISQAVASRVAGEERAALERALLVHRRLTEAALAHGAAPGAVRVLAREYGGWAAVVDASGAVLHAAPEAAAAEAAEAAAEAGGLRSREGQSLSFVDARGHLVGHALGTGAARGMLLIWRRAAFTGPEHSVVAAAASLVTYEFEQRRAATAQARRSSADAVHQALREGADPAAARRLLSAWGLDPAAVTVLVARAARWPGDAHDVLADQDLPVLAAAGTDGETVLLTSEPERVLALLEDRTAGVGASGRVGAGELAEGLRQARQALVIGLREGRQVTSVGDLGVIELLLASAERSVPDALVRRLIDPLRRAETERGIPLVATVRAFLDNNGSVARASAELSVHRHTLHFRLGVVGDVLDADLDSSYVRLELALALQAHALRGDAAAP